MKMKLKKGDKVIVIAGKHKGVTSTIVRALPNEGLVVLDNVNMVKKHRRRTSAQQSGQIVNKAMPIHISNVQLIDPKSGKPTRVKIVAGKKGERTRIAVKSGQTI
jgi:large subunit ribosomal protein L24